MLKNRIKYGIVLIAAILLYLFFNNFFFFYLLLITVSLPVISFAVSRFVWKRLRISASIPLEAIGEGNEVPVEFTVENRSVFPLPGVRLEYLVENLFYKNSETQIMNLPLRHGKSVYKWSIKSVCSGRIELSGKSLSMQEYLGLFNFRKKWNCTVGVDCIPACSDVIMNIVEEAMTEGDNRDSDISGTVEDVTQIKEFRQYIPGDRMQRVNWKLSARHNELYVKEFEREYNQVLTLLVELHRDSEKTGFLNDTITAFYSAALKLIEMEIRFDVSWFDSAGNIFRTESVEEEEGLNYALSQIFRASSYEDYRAFDSFKEKQGEKKYRAIYFTSPEFYGCTDDNIIGSFNERVVMVCI